MLKDNIGMRTSENKLAMNKRRLWTTERFVTEGEEQPWYCFSKGALKQNQSWFHLEHHFCQSTTWHLWPWGPLLCSLCSSGSESHPLAPAHYFYHKGSRVQKHYVPWLCVPTYSSRIRKINYPLCALLRWVSCNDFESPHHLHSSLPWLANRHCTKTTLALSFFPVTLTPLQR